MKQSPNMKDYKKEYREFFLSVPERFSFPVDVFDKWGELPKTISGKIKRKELKKKEFEGKITESL